MKVDVTFLDAVAMLDESTGASVCKPRGPIDKQVGGVFDELRRRLLGLCDVEQVDVIRGENTLVGFEVDIPDDLLGPILRMWRMSGDVKGVDAILILMTLLRTGLKASLLAANEGLLDVRTTFDVNGTTLHVLDGMLTFTSNPFPFYTSDRCVGNFYSLSGGGNSLRFLESINGAPKPTGVKLLGADGQTYKFELVFRDLGDKSKFISEFRGIDTHV